MNRTISRSSNLGVKGKSVKVIFQILLFNSLFFNSIIGQSQQSDTSTNKHLEAIEVRAIRASSSAPFVNTTLNQQEISVLNQGKDLPYLLQFTPSIVSFSDAGAGVGYTGMRLRGTDGTRINVTLNGIPVNDAESQGTFFVNFPDLASSTKSIQLQRGVGTSTNGSGAFGATMSIDNLDQKDTAGIEINNSYGSFNTWKNTIKLSSGLLKNGIQTDLRASHISSDGVRDRTASKLGALQLVTGWKISNSTGLKFMAMTGNEKTYQAWNGVLGSQLNGDSADLQRHYQHNIGALYFTSQDSINLFSTYPYRYNYFTYKNQTDNYRQNYFQLFFNHRFQNLLQLQVAAFLTRGKGFYEEFKNNQKYKEYGLPSYVASQNADTITKTNLIRQLWLDNYNYGSIFSLHYATVKSQITLGGSLSEYQGTHYGYIKWSEKGGIPDDFEWYHLPAKKKDLSVYTKAQHQVLNKLYLFGDLQLRYVDYSIKGFRKNPSIKINTPYLFFNPKAGVSYFISQQSQQSQKLYASIALANKEPNRDDFEASPNHLPQPERLTDIEAGYELNHTKWNFSANAYYMYYTNQLILTGKINDVGAYTRTNAPKSFRTGLEVQFNGHLLSWLHLGANATYSENKVLDFVEYIDNWDDGSQIPLRKGTTDLAFSPRFIGNMSLTFKPFVNQTFGKRLDIMLLGKYVSKQYLDNSGNNIRIIKPYFVSDINLRYSLQFKPIKEIGFILGLQNIFNRKYVSNGYSYAYNLGGTTYTDNYYFPQAGFNWVLSINMKL
ncbi:MAG TPA: TonB-dependent receptor [Flavipsychrobacter sp.]|nr:TonB-dependent receptor [Flavipsychrobacter sp.]